MNKLWVRLTLAFGLVTVIAIVMAAVLANAQLSTEFRRFVTHNQMLDSVAPALTEYYVRHGTWAGIETAFENLRGPGGSGAGRGQRRGAPNLILADVAGQVVYDGSTGRPGRFLSRVEEAQAVPLTWQSQMIGQLVVTAPGRNELSASAQNFLDQVNRSLLQAGLIAGGLGLGLGLVIARGLSAPLGRLATAARRIARGQLDQQVPVKGTDELANLAQAFNEMAVHLRQAETLRRNLVADIAHELRTPLSVVQGNLQAILDGVYPLEKSEIAAIYDETLILNRLIDDLRELAQAEAGQLSLSIRPTALAPLITDSVELFAELAREKEIRLEATVPDRLPPVLADPDRVRQVLNNLLSNALRHTPKQGRITVGVEDPAPWQAGFSRPASPPPVNPSAGTLFIWVTDTGPGIPPEDLPHLFDRFWRADKSRARGYGGSGLGLAIARQLVEAHGGQIGVTSPGPAGPGSQFWFTLPAAPA